MEHEYEAPVAENKTLKYVMSPTGHKKKISIERDVYLTVVQYKPNEGKFLFIQEPRFHRKLATYTIKQEHLEHTTPYKFTREMPKFSNGTLVDGGD